MDGKCCLDSRTELPPGSGENSELLQRPLKPGGELLAGHAAAVMSNYQRKTGGEIDDLLTFRSFGAAILAGLSRCMGSEMQVDGEVSLEDLSVAIDREPPIAVFSFSDSYFQAARYLREAFESDRLKLPFDAPIYYLYSHALELAMKAFLRAKGMSGRELRSSGFGHQLLVLWQTCLEKGLYGPSTSATATVGQVIKVLDPYASEFEFRYIQVGTKSLPTLNDVELAAVRVLSMVRPFIPEMRQRALIPAESRARPLTELRHLPR